ncbi:electron transfer flavoprotein subunit beta/FixA family protein [Clostridium sediminicola]|uniref:electron transfer flavoprotein subunit beta/FixA family protein n=1 Tax=Clostridium sediminicola TaxID=3114879 RepID=UPI0031F1F72B
MDILVCFKIVPDLDMLSSSDWVVSSHCEVDTSFAKPMFNLYDEAALELVLKLRDQAENKIESLNLTALTIGNSFADRFLKNLYALKYHNAVRVNYEEDIRFNSPFVAKIISNYIEKEGKIGIVVLGNQSGVGDNGKTPFILAELLGIPLISGVTSITPSEEEGYFTVISTKDDIKIKQVVKAPIILSVGNIQSAYLRVPTLKDKMAAKKKRIKILDLEHLGIEKEKKEEENDVTLIDIFYEKKERVCEIVEGGDAKEKAKILYEKYLKERLAE